MTPPPTLIAAYPRSGSTWLRFILCNLFHPDIDHDFDSVNCHMPGIDDPAGVVAGIDHPFFYKTHERRHGTSVVFLHRHVGDVMISEWWYKRKMWGEHRGFEDYLVDTDYGKEWREFTDFYYPCLRMISYEELGSSGAVGSIVPWIETWQIENAIAACSFDSMQAKEEKGFGIYPSGDPKIRFCRSGTTGQWKEWPEQVQAMLLEKNKIHLKLLGYE